jgi:hypothetical protein
VTHFDAIRDFTELYLLPFHSTKEIELIQLRVNRKIERKSKSSEDVLFKTVLAFRETLRLLNKMRRELRHPSHFTRDPEHKLYFELLELSPADCLNLIAETRYQLPDENLSLILQNSSDHIRFRRTQLLHQFKDEGFTKPDFAKVTPKSLLISADFSRTGRRELDQTSYNTRLVKGSVRPINAQRALRFSQRFKALPFYARFATETSGVIVMIILLMWIIPEIRNTFENSVQKRINDYLIESSLVDSPAPAGTTKEAKPISLPETPDTDEETSAVTPITSGSRKQPRVVDGETWRFSFTGSQTSDIESGIESILKRMSLDQKSLTVPGGIQFDLIFPTSKVIDLKTSLEEMSEEIQRKSGTGKQGAMSAANLSWYKKHNMGTRKIPASHVQVIIWISTL